MTRGVGPVDAACEDSDGGTSGGECCAVGGALDAVGPAAGDGETAVGEPSYQGGCDVLPVAGCCACAGDGDGSVHAAQGVDVAVLP